MNEPPAPFDEFAHPDRDAPTGRQGFLHSWARASLQAISFAGLWLALLTAIFIVALHAFRAAGGSPPGFLWTPKSAIPLIVIGLSYLSLIFTVPRTWGQRFLGVLVSVAFIFWGAEQFMNDVRWISLIDDIVVFLFVLDLSIVIRKNLAESSVKRPVHKAGLGQ